MFPTDGHTGKSDREKNIARKERCLSLRSRGPGLRCPLRFFRGDHENASFSQNEVQEKKSCIPKADRRSAELAARLTSCRASCCTKNLEAYRPLRSSLSSTRGWLVGRRRLPLRAWKPSSTQAPHCATVPRLPGLKRSASARRTPGASTARNSRDTSAAHSSVGA